MINTSIEEELKTKGKVIISTRGSSMEPLLYERETLVEIHQCFSFDLLDAVLFKRKNGQLVLHRIIEVNQDYCIICGDNLCTKEVVENQQILGKMNRFYRNGKWYETSCKKYLRYVHTWFCTYRLHCLFVQMYHMIRRVRRWKKRIIRK